MKILCNRFVISNPRLYLAALLAAIVWANSGCRRSDAQFKELNQRVNTLSKLDDIYNQYVAGNRTEAKKCLLSGVELLENSSCFEENARAQLLSLEYSRLAVMEHKLGDNNAQDAYLLCAQYWQLKPLNYRKNPLQRR
jgi:transcriptional accessory protein Tex/SPT6